MKSVPYLMSSMLAAESDHVIINTCFDLVSCNDLGTHYGALYACMLECWKRHKLLEPVALHIEITTKYSDDKHQKKLIEQLMEIWDLVLTPGHWMHYLSLCLAEIKLSKLKALGNVMAGKDNSPKFIDDMLTDAKTQITSISEKYKLSQERTLDTMTTDFLNEIDKEASGGYENKIKTGLYYEQHISGFRAGDYIILAGATGVGKSAFANTIIAEVAKNGKRVMYVNREMSERQMIGRLKSNLYSVSHELIEKPETMSQYQLSELMRVSDEFRKLPIELYSSSLRTPAQIEAEFLRLRGIGRPVDFIVLDYLTLFSTGEKHKSLYEEVSALSWQFKTMATDLSVPVLCLAQLSRKPSERTNKRPLLSDLRESGTIEQDATAVMLIYRDEMYNENSPDIGIAEIHVAKNRNGKTGTDKYYVNFDHMKISNLDTRSEQ